MTSLLSLTLPLSSFHTLCPRFAGGPHTRLSSRASLERATSSARILSVTSQ